MVLGRLTYQWISDYLSMTVLFVADGLFPVSGCLNKFQYNKLPTNGLL